MKIKLFEEFHTEEGTYFTKAKKLLYEIESIMGVKIAEPNLYYELVDYGKITSGGLENILFKISELDLVQETIMNMIVNSLYPEVRETKRIKEIYWTHVEKWHKKIEKVPDLYKSEEFQEKLRDAKKIIKNSGLKEIVLNSPEYAVIANANKYNL